MNTAGLRRIAPIAALLLAPLCAQADRYELGLRLRAFERALDATADAAKRRPALRAMEDAVQAFFRIDVGGVARAIDTAAAALAGSTPDAAARFAQSLQAALRARLLDRTVDTVPFDVEAVYRVDDELPTGLAVEFADANGTVLTTMPVTEVPLRGELPLAALPAGDHVLRVVFRRGETVLAAREHGISIVKDLTARLAALEGVGDGERTLELATLAMLQRDLRTMTRARREETVLPGADLLAFAERTARAIADNRALAAADLVGDHRLALPTASGITALRVWAPATAADAPPPPLVLALHGAGGSENLFFDGYGDGLGPRLAAARGWLFVAPRLSPLAPQGLTELLDALARHHRFDPARVFVIGHSMGAMQAVANVTAARERFRGLAALGGGGSVRRGRDLAHLPCFVGTGTRDFGRRGAEALHAALSAAGADSALHRYDDVEHLTVVQIALPEVFAFFDATLR